jgi:hypothetical protein
VTALDGESNTCDAADILDSGSDIVTQDAMLDDDCEYGQDTTISPDVTRLVANMCPSHPPRLNEVTEDDMLSVCDSLASVAMASAVDSIRDSSEGPTSDWGSELDLCDNSEAQMNEMLLEDGDDIQ